MVTCPSYSELRPEDELVRQALQQRGHSSGAVEWPSPEATVPPLVAGRALLVRATWDYHFYPAQFRTWLEQLHNSPLMVWNSPALMLWNMHKGYLIDLQAAGASIVPTCLVRAGEQPPDSLWDGVMIAKPAVGAGARGAKMGGWEEIREHASQLLTDEDVILQPYQNSVETYGERSLIFFEGQFSHAVLRTWAIVEGQGLDRLMPRVEPSPAELQVGLQALACLKECPLYARVDLVADAQGTPRILELEVIEPRLFLLECPEASQTLAEACHRRLLTLA